MGPAGGLLLSGERRELRVEHVGTSGREWPRLSMNHAKATHDVEVTGAAWERDVNTCAVFPVASTFLPKDELLRTTILELLSKQPC